MASLEKIEESQFVGRTQEIETFRRLFFDRIPEHKCIVNVYGTGGVGKSFLLRQFRRIVERGDGYFVLLDARDLSRTQTDVYYKIIESIGGNPQSVLGDSLDGPHSILRRCIEYLNVKAQEHRLAMALDGYEELDGLERRIRENFLQHLSKDILIVLAGRQSLAGAWVSSPAWQDLILRMPLHDFDQAEIHTYLKKAGVSDESTISLLTHFSQGHPLTLAMALAVAQSRTVKSPPLTAGQHADAFTEVMHVWLREVPHDGLRELVEAASILRSFNKDILEAMLRRTITSRDYAYLTRLSFVRQSSYGWSVHDVARELVISDLRHKSYAKYQEWFKRAVSFYYQRIQEDIKTDHVSHEAREFFFHVGDAMTRAVCFHSRAFSKHRIEVMDRYNWREFQRYLDLKQEKSYDKLVRFTDHQRQYELVVPQVHDQTSMIHLNAKELLDLDQDIVHMVKGEDGQILGVAIIIPINVATLDFLRTKPVTRTYFSLLDERSLEQLRVPADTYAGHFLRNIDVLDPKDALTRSELLNLTLSYIALGGIILSSSPLKFFDELLQSHGFHIVEGATHHDFGPDLPAHTHLLDLRGVNRRTYYAKMLANAGILETATSQFTSREQEVAEFLLKGWSNDEIARALHLSEISIKKHISNMLAKTNTKNRVQLMNVLQGPLR